MKPALIIFAGLPGTGKTTIAREVSRRFGAVYLRVDSIEQAIVNSTLGVSSAEEAGYKAAYALAEENLRIGNVVVADSVNSIEISRTAWLEVAQHAGVTAVEVEIVCTDRDQHKERVETRKTDISGLKFPTWLQVLEREYEPWDRGRIVIDTANRSIVACVEELVQALIADVEAVPPKARVY